MCAKMWVFLVFTSSLIIRLISAVGDGEGRLRLNISLIYLYILYTRIQISVEQL
jgi:hypothetical protein